MKITYLINFYYQISLCMFFLTFPHISNFISINKRIILEQDVEVVIVSRLDLVCHMKF